MELGEIGRVATEAFDQVNKTTTALSTGRFTVTKDNVLAAAKILQTQAETLAEKLDTARRDMRIAPPGDDDVSTRMAPAWNDLLVDNETSYANRIGQYIDGINNLARQCAESAKTYGYTDEQISAAFGGQGE
jgi:PE family